MLQALGDLALREDDLGEARRRYESALAIYPQIGARLGEANVQKALGDLALREADLGEARRRYESALAIYPQIGARLGEANVLQALGDLALREADLGGARRRYESALAIYPQIGARLAEAAVYIGLGRLTDEEHYFERALAIHAQIRSYYDFAVDSFYFGRSQAKLGNNSRARELLETARKIWVEIGLPSYAQVAQQSLDSIPANK